MHTQTVVTLGAFVISVGGWFLWNILLAVIFKGGFGPYLVKDAFLHNFGGTLKWWTAALVTLVAPTLFEIGVAALRRTYFPTDQDRMQVIERYEGVMEIMRDHAAELGEATQPADERPGVTPRASADATSFLEASGMSGEPNQKRVSRASESGRGSMESNRMSARIDEEYYQPPPFTPPAEEKDDPIAKATAMSGDAGPDNGGPSGAAKELKVNVPTLNLRPPTSPAGWKVTSGEFVDSPGAMLSPSSAKGSSVRRPDSA